MRFILQTSLLCIIILTITACGSRDGLAPVVELNWRSRNIHDTQHVVVHGETLYAIAFRYDTDYRELATINKLQRPYSLRIGQVIRLHHSTPSHNYYQKPRARVTQPYVRKPYTPIFSRSSKHWMWPAHGRIVANFVPSQGKKGIDIAGKQGDNIYASANGVVAYSGSGLAGYGNLIIIKHENQYLTAYGHNASNLVREGQTVKAGQIIAKMGFVDRHYWGVHFEIRYAGQPVNPLSFLR